MSRLPGNGPPITWKGIGRWATIAGAVLLLAACDRGEFGEVETGEPADLSSLSYVDNLLVKEEADEWTRGQGLVATLRVFVGEIELSEILESGELVETEGTGIIKMAHEYLVDGPDIEAKAEINRLLTFLVFSNEQLEAMAGISPPTASAGGIQLGVVQGAVKDCNLFYHDYTIPSGVGPCLEVKSITLNGKVYRVFAPAAPLPLAGWTDEHVELALEAMKETVLGAPGLTPGFGELGEMPPVNVILSIVEAGTTLASAAPATGKTCGVTLYISMQQLSDGNFKQSLAHELGHCFQQENFPAQNEVNNEYIRWREEGLAEYLSNVAYPSNNSEWGRMITLTGTELHTSLLDRAYDNTAFFQFLANRRGNGGVFDVVRSLPSSGGKSQQEKALAAVSGMTEIFHDYAKALTEGNIEDTGGGTLPYSPPLVEVLIDREATPIFEKELGPFSVARLFIYVNRQHASLGLVEHGEVKDSVLKPGATDWTEFPNSLPDQECNNWLLAVFTTTDRPGVVSGPISDNAFQIDVPLIIDVSPGGLVGEWVVDNGTIKKQITNSLWRDAPNPTRKLVDVSGTVTALFRNGGALDVTYDGFHVEAELSAAEARFGLNRDYTGEQTFLTNAKGTTTYQIAFEGDDLWFGTFLESDFLRGSETVTLVEEAFIPFAGEEIPHEVDEEFERNPPVGWSIFVGIQGYEVLCDGTKLVLSTPGQEDVVLHRVGDGPGSEKDPPKGFRKG